ncbi:MAG: hypothetical protein ACI4KF_05055 [Huintestinicola sp.]
MAKALEDDFSPVENSISKRMAVSMIVVFVVVSIYSFCLSIFSETDNFIFECFYGTQKMGNLYYHIYSDKHEAECCGVAISYSNACLSDGMLTADITVSDACGELHNVYSDEFLIKVYQEGKCEKIEPEDFDKIVLPEGGSYSFTLRTNVADFDLDEGSDIELFYFHGDPRTSVSFMLDIV